MQRNVIAVVDDMFFASKIRTTAEALGVTIKVSRGREALLASAQENPPDLIVVDLHNQKLNAIELAAELKSNEKLKAIPLLAFFSHVETDLQRQAIQAGYDEVVPRSFFTRELASILVGERQKPGR